MKKCYEILMTVGIVAVLLLLSLGLLKLPKRYFEYSDKQLNGVLSIGGYDIDDGVKSMTREQIVKVFDKEDVLMIEEEPPVLDGELAERLIEGSLREYLRMFFDRNGADIAYMLTDLSNSGEVSYQSTAYNVIDVENEEIYSARLGVIVLQDYWSPFIHIGSMEILFSLDTYDILGVSLFSAEVSGWEFDKYLSEKTDIINRLNAYYGDSISWGNEFDNQPRVEFGWSYITILPWDYRTTEKKVFQTLEMSLVRSNHLYSNFTEMIQE